MTVRSLGSGTRAGDSQCLQDLLGYIANIDIRIIPGFHDQVYGVRLGINRLVCVTFPH